MKLLKLVIVDDEPILLEGLLKTYDWAGTVSYTHLTLPTNSRV